MSDPSTHRSEREVLGNNPLLLDDLTGIWQVRSGWVDVFAVLPWPGESAGVRFHLWRAETGDCLFGVHAAGPSHCLAVGTPESRVERLSRDEFQQKAATTAVHEQFIRILDRWTCGLTVGATRGRQPPRDVEPLQPGVESSRAAGTGITPVRGTLWVPVYPDLYFLGEERLPLTESPGTRELFPVSVPGWLTARDNVTLTGQPTETMLTDPRLWAGLDRFHQIILACVAQLAEKATADQGDRWRRRAQRDQHLLATELAGFGAPLRAGLEDDLTFGPADDPLLTACRLVGAALGIAVKAPVVTATKTPAADTTSLDRHLSKIQRVPQGPGEGRRPVDPVEAIARASRFRVRRVQLAGDWWRHDNGPLLGFDTTDHRPVALLPLSPSRYERVDGATRTRAPLTAANAQHLEPGAYQFYRPFPATALTPWRLFQFGLGGSHRDWLMVVVLGLAGGLLALFTPIATGWIFDWIIPGAEWNQLLVVVLALATAALATALLRLTRGVAVLRLEMKMDTDVQAALWDRLLDLPPIFFRSYTTGDLATRANGLGTLRWLLTDFVLGALLNCIFSLVYVGLLFYYDVRLALLGCLLFLIFCAVTCLAGLRELPYQQRVYQARGTIAGIVLQLITGLSRLRVAAAETRALAVWVREFRTQRRLEYRARRVANVLASFTEAAPLFSTMVLFATVALLPRQGLSLGEFLAFNVAFVQLLSAGLSVSGTVGTLIEIVPLYGRTRPILDAVPEADTAQTIPGDLQGDVEISHVSFRYQPDGPLILDDISLHIRPGEFVAFVGPSGAGKSTLLRLLLGFEKPTAGALFYDGEDMARLDLQTLRRQAGVVLQNARTLPGTILDNIIGAAPLNEQDAWQAARLAGLDEDVNHLPQKMHTLLGEAGSTLSGGQRQRLMIARAIACRPRLLFFDEATSAQDNETQARVSRGLANLKATRVIVAHRLSTIIDADRIFVVDGGRIVEQGKFDELLQQNGLFAELVKRQIA